jgi:hypothetical protein
MNEMLPSRVISAEGYVWDHPVDGTRGLKVYSKGGGVLGKFA